jgi:hypothetical protein
MFGESEKIGSLASIPANIMMCSALSTRLKVKVNTRSLQVYRDLPILMGVQQDAGFPFTLSCQKNQKPYSA